MPYIASSSSGTLIGLLVVCALAVIIMIVVKHRERNSRSADNSGILSATSKVEGGTSPTPIDTQASGDEELVAVLTAAVAAFSASSAQSGSVFNIKSYRKMGNSIWNRL